MNPCENWAVQERFLTDDEIKDAKAMVDWQFWATPVVFVILSVGLGIGIGALGRNPAIIFVISLFVSLTVVLCLVWVSRYKKVTQDIERRVVEVIEGAPEQVWLSRGFCYLGIAGLTIRVPNDSYGDLRQSNKAKVAFLPTALVAVKVECFRGIGLSLRIGAGDKSR
jgi:hypothetical protein